MTVVELVCRVARVVACLMIFAAGATAHAQSANGDARRLWQLLDYIAVDYGEAIANGQIINESEYAEMLEFTQAAAVQLQILPGHASSTRIAQLIRQLTEAVRAKESKEQVALLAQQAAAAVLEAYPMPLAPATTPDLALGGRLYVEHCASCHGAGGAGDGVAAKGLDPAPIAFTDAERASSRSVLALYQVITQGVEGTSMPAFDNMSDDERWALAFLVGGMAYNDSARERGREIWSSEPKARSFYEDLTVVATVSQSEAASTFGADAARDLTAFLRYEPAATATADSSGTSLARRRLGDSLRAMQAGDQKAASSLALSAYLDGFEPNEPMLATRNQKLLDQVEEAMLQYRAAVGARDLSKAQSVAAGLDALLVQVDAELGESRASSLTTYFGALTILLREGLEALLIVVGIVAFLKKADRPGALRAVHGGWLSALAAGGLTWLAATHLVTISGASRELTEGLGALFAAFVLLGVGLWMHQKSAAGRWQMYLEGKVSAAARRRSAWGLFVLTFVAVYREVFETILFYSALATDGNEPALMAGLSSAVLLLTFIAWLLLRTSARMPIGKFFALTSVAVGLLAVVLAGKGVSALQEAGWINVRPVNAPHIDLLGVYPTAQTLGAQIAVLLVLAIGAALQRRNRNA